MLDSRGSDQQKQGIRFQKGDVYQSELKGENRHDWGKQVWLGSVYEGFWENNMKAGYGTMIYVYRDAHEGEQLNDKANGLGKIHISGAQYIEYFKDDKSHGIWKENV